MSAPQTNIEKQKRWHRGPLVGIVVAVLFVLGLFAYWLMYETHTNSDAATDPDGGQLSPGGNPTDPAPLLAPAPAPAP